MIRFDRFTLKAQEAVQESQSVAEKHEHQAVDVEHLLYALVSHSDGIVQPIIKKLGADPQNLLKKIDDELKKIPKVSGGAIGQTFITPRLNQVFTNAFKEAERLKDEYVSTEHILIANTDEKGGVSSRLLSSAGITKDNIFKVLIDIRGSQRVTENEMIGDCFSRYDYKHNLKWLSIIILTIFDFGRGRILKSMEGKEGIVRHEIKNGCRIE